MSSFDSLAGVFGLFTCPEDVALRLNKAKIDYPALNFAALDWLPNNPSVWCRYGKNVFIGTDKTIGANACYLWAMSGYPGVRVDTSA